MNATVTATAVSYSYCLAGVALLIVGFTAQRFRSSPTTGKLPPGPPGLPIMGNIFQIPQFQWLRFTEWKEQYGSIFSLNFAGQPVIILNTHEVATDLLDRRSSIYSDRPRLIVAGEIMTGGIFLGFSAYGDLWRRLRKAAHEGLNIRSAEAYQPLQEHEAAVLAKNLLSEPDAWDDHLKRSAASATITAVYAVPPIESKDDPLVVRINDVMHRIMRAALPGAHLVELFPIMNYLPAWMAKWKRDGLEWHEKDTVMFEGFMDRVRDDVASGNCKPCFAASLIENGERHKLTRKEASWLAGTVFGAGAETTAAALSVFILAMSHYPNVMRKAQAELDVVVGRERLPTFADKPNLPYIRAMVKEVLRWRPVVPLIPRRSMQDDWYNGYFIPKGTVIIGNTWAMNRDPALFPDFDEFRPERFLDETGAEGVTPSDRHAQEHVGFGFGRRLCVGMHIANQALFIDIASILWSVNIGPAIDSDGKEILPSRTDVVDEGLVVRPASFACRITTRFPDIAATPAIA